MNSLAISSWFIHFYPALVLSEQANYNDRIIFVIFVTDCDVLPVELWEYRCKFISLPVDSKYQKGQSRDNDAILLFNLNLSVTGFM